MFQLKVSTNTIKKKGDYFVAVVFMYFCCCFILFTEELEEMVLAQGYRSLLYGYNSTLALIGC